MTNISKSLSSELDNLKKEGLYKEEKIILSQQSNIVQTTKIEETMNRFGLQGWEVVFQVIEKRRMLLFWNREAMVITFSRELKD